MFGLTSTEFVIVLPIVVLLYYLVPARIRCYYLLLINMIFYCSFGYKFMAVVVLEALVAFVSASFIGRCQAENRKKVILTLGIILLSSILLLFKVGAKVHSSIVAPLGISFYTLQAISYVVDVYKEQVKVEKNPLKLLIYLSFFPTITSGPIYRYKDFTPCFEKINKNFTPDYYRITNGIIYMIYGYFLKLVVAERAAIPVNQVFEEFKAEDYGGTVLLIVAITYSIQIYADFAGYSAIVIGIAQVLGYDIPENFRAPYLAKSIKEFWGRWHISLSSWLKDYIYIPLGGNRKGKLRKYANIMITFLISGFWHGGGIHFIVWGAMHGIYQIVGDLLLGIRQKVLPMLGIVEDSSFHQLLKRTGTFVLVTAAWVFFRTGVRDALSLFAEIIMAPHVDYLIAGKLWELGLTPFGWMLLSVGVMIMGFVDRLTYRDIRIDKALQKQGTLARCVSVIVFALVILILGIYGDQHDASYFVYRDF